MRVAVDTNVWVSGLIVPRSPPGRILQAVRRRELDVVISWELAAELREVLDRPKLRFYEFAEDDIHDLLSLTAPDLPTVEVDVELRDPDDVAVVVAAIAGRADTIVTGDRALLEDAGLRTWLLTRSVELLTPAELLERL